MQRGLVVGLLFVLGAHASLHDANAQSASQATETTSTLANEAYTYLHENPELGGREFLAQTYLSEKLSALSAITMVMSESAPTAVIGVFNTGRPGPTIALRAELDARELTEGTTEPVAHNPRSTIDGVMHNCGHDVHAAILLGAAERLVRTPDLVSGKIVFLFQPAEETRGGADDIVEEGILAELGVDAIFALHVAPGLDVGNATITSGASLAGSNYFTLTLTGKGSHAAVPYEGNDLPLTATKFVEALSNLPARRVDIANRPFVLSVARLIADSGSRNVIPTKATIAGTIRSFEDIDDRPDGQPSIRDIVTGTIRRLADAYGVEATMELREAAPPTVNDPVLLQTLSAKINATWGGSLSVIEQQGMFSEDFAYYTADIPALYFSLGVAKDGLGNAGVHTPDFTVHPDSLDVGQSLFVSIASAMSTP